MSNRKATQQMIRTHQGETLDALLWRFYGVKIIGSTLLEKVLALNHGLADVGEVLPQGMVVVLPLVASTATKKEVVQLWQ